MMKTVMVYHGDNLLGEVELFPEKNELVNGIRISHFSQASERCPPLAVLHTISTSGVWFKMESKPQFQETPLLALHATCFRDNKTAVMVLGEDELHLAAMPSRRNNSSISCFWGFRVRKGLYNSSLVMLNLRCLGIVFDLDETLIVANTLKSFEDRIESVRRKMNSEVDPKRLTGMVAEIKRYQEDKALLRQYAENDQIIDNGKVIKVQSEIVPALSDSHQSIVRPIIRLQEKNIILTRINPQIRDTSVLVRMRPAWEDLRSYLTAGGRKRFEVYVCTLAERDYALEMWRLLDPDANLINTSELLDRIVCVKHGARKSLFNVFNDGSCHPRMAMVIDDRIIVWDEKDQPRVHIVPPFVPYYAPEAEANNSIPILCVARYVACNVRGGFFKEFDNCLLQQISEVSHEDDLKNILPPPDVSSYLSSEDDASTLEGNKEQLHLDGMADAGVERRLKEVIAASSAFPSAAAASTANLDARLAASLQLLVTASSLTVPLPGPGPPSINPFLSNHLQATSLVRPLGHAGPMDLTRQGSPAREEGEVPESELDPDTRRRLLILQHGLDTREHSPNEPPFPVRPPVQTPVQIPVQTPVPIPGQGPGPGPGPGPRVRPGGSWLPAEDQMSPGPLSRAMGPEYPLPTDVMHFGKQRPPPPPTPPFQRKIESPFPSDCTFLSKQRLPREVPRREDRSRPNYSLHKYPLFSGEVVSSQRLSSCNKDFVTESSRPYSSNKDSETESDPPSSSSNKDFDTAPGHGFPSSDAPAGALHEIAMKCGTQVEFRPSLIATTELKFQIQVYFAGERIGEGIGKTRKEAQNQAAEASLMYLADKYLSHTKDDSGLGQGESNQLMNAHENDFLSDSNSYKNQTSVCKESTALSATEDPPRPKDFSLDDSKKSVNSVSSLKELCLIEGLGIDFKSQPVVSASGQMDEVHVEVEIDGQILGKGIASTLDDAKIQASEIALSSLKPKLDQFIQRHPGGFPRSTTQGQRMSAKRLKLDPRRIFQRPPSPGYSTNPSPVP
ncbi:hypothetical protein Dimus_035201 [Dionaea muscipula]